MTKLGGFCHCGKVKIEIRLAQAPAAYAPRACDCSFCRKRSTPRPSARWKSRWFAKVILQTS